MSVYVEGKYAVDKIEENIFFTMYMDITMYLDKKKRHFKICIWIKDKLLSLYIFKNALPKFIMLTLSVP